MASLGLFSELNSIELGLLETYESRSRNLANIFRTCSVKLAGRIVDRQLGSCIDRRSEREFLSEKAKSHLSKETMGKPTEAASVSPPRHDRVIHVILVGLEISGISHAAAKKSTWNAKHGVEAAKPKRLLLGTYKISFTAKEHRKVLTPHHDALVISLTVANCLVKRILVDNGSYGNIIFQAAYKDLGQEESTLTQRITPLIGKDQGLIAVTDQGSGSSHRGTIGELAE
ncbi:hypothetical protein DY000_02015649 [Brassica cretica]|uniref:Uncharacterized protein n=1 Tax=Brassica cretica TaxID=69181 RepID=A0ABQ7CVB4_BRACR|nr:hypothetical protein DY000_02015649 [Brassica cretica]